MDRHLTRYYAFQAKLRIIKLYGFNSLSLARHGLRSRSDDYDRRTYQRLKLKLAFSAQLDMVNDNHYDVGDGCSELLNSEDIK